MRAAEAPAAPASTRRPPGLGEPSSRQPAPAALGPVYLHYLLAIHAQRLPDVINPTQRHPKYGRWVGFLSFLPTVAFRSANLAATDFGTRP